MNQKGKVFSLIAVSGAMLFSFAIIGKNFDLLGAKAANVDITNIEDSFVFREPSKAVDGIPNRYSSKTKSSFGTQLYLISIYPNSNIDPDGGVLNFSDSSSTAVTFYVSEYENGKDPSTGFDSYYRFQNINSVSFGISNLGIVSGSYTNTPTGRALNEQDTVVPESIRDSWNSSNKTVSLSEKGRVLKFYGMYFSISGKATTVSFNYACDYTYIDEPHEVTKSYNTDAGTIIITSDTQLYEGEECTFSFTNKEILKFDHFYIVDHPEIEIKSRTIGVFEKIQYYFIMPNYNVTLSAAFNKFSLTSNAVQHGSVQIETSEYQAGETASFIVSPDTGYQIGSVTSSQVSSFNIVGNTYSFTMPAKDVVVSASFDAITYSVSVDPNIEHGSVSVDKSQCTAGTNVVVSVNPDQYYEIEFVLYNGTPISPVNDVYSFVMPFENVTVSAQFITNYLHVDVDSNIEHGSVSVDKVLCLEGDTVTVTASPDSGYELDNILVDEDEIEGTTFEMPDHDVEVSASFVAVVETYNVSVDPSIEHGSVSVNPSQCVEGENVTVTATPDSGYELDAILVDGVEIEGITFDMPNHDVEVSATFVQVYSITIDPYITNGTVTASTNQSRAGNEINLTVTPAEGYEVESVSYNSIEIMPINNNYSFIMPSNVVAVTATFKKKSAPSFDPYVVLASSNISGTDNNGQSMSFVFSNEKTGTQSITKGFVSPVYTFTYELEKKSDYVYSISFPNVVKKSGNAAGVTCMLSNVVSFTVTFSNDFSEVISAHYEFYSITYSSGGEINWSK